MGQDREDERLREEVVPPRRLPRAEDDTASQARRQAADLRAHAVRRRALLHAFLAFCAFQLLGALIGFSSFHATTVPRGKVILYLGLTVGDVGSVLAVWCLYFRRQDRGDW